MKKKSPYDPKKAGMMGGRPFMSGKPRHRKSIVFLGEAVDLIAAIGEKMNISHADVLHLGLLLFSNKLEVENSDFVAALQQKAEALESDDLIREIKKI